MLERPLSGEARMAKPFRISAKVTEKLIRKHQVTREEITQCFMNREGPSFRDPREKHDTDPPSVWFVAPTDRGRLLKVVYMEFDSYFAIKTAFPPDDGSDRLYERLCAKRAPRELVEGEYVQEVQSR